MHLHMPVSSDVCERNLPEIKSENPFLVEEQKKNKMQEHLPVRADLSMVTELKVLYFNFPRTSPQSSHLCQEKFCTKS